MPNDQHRYVLGADTAEGLEHGDYSCAQVLDLSSGVQVASWHGHIEADLFGEEIDRLGRFYGLALVCVESNNHGLTTITTLRRLGYPMLFRARSLNRAKTKQTMEYGWKTTTTSKPLMIDELAMALRNHEIQVRDKRTIAELRTYVRDEKGHTNGSPYDDRVMALAVANQMRKYAFQPEYVPVVDDYWTGAWWARQGTDQGQTWVLGKHSVRR
jgi:hypothetical protein